MCGACIRQICSRVFNVCSYASKACSGLGRHQRSLLLTRMLTCRARKRHCPAVSLKGLRRPSLLDSSFIRERSMVVRFSMDGPATDLRVAPGKHPGPFVATGPACHQRYLLTSASLINRTQCTYYKWMFMRSTKLSICLYSAIRSHSIHDHCTSRLA